MGCDQIELSMVFDNQSCKHFEDSAERNEECQASEGELEAVTDSEYIVEKCNLMHLDKMIF